VYIFRLWFANEREAIAREEVALSPVWAELRAEFPTPAGDRAIHEAFEKAVRITTHNIHPLVILGIRPKITE